MRTIHVDRRTDQFVDRLLKLAFPSERSRKCQIKQAKSVPLTNNYWSGGSKSFYSAVNLERMAVLAISALPKFSDPQEFGGPPPLAFELHPNIALIKHSIFCGKDMGFTIYVNPQTATKLLPNPTTAILTDNQRKVLDVTKAYIASYRHEASGLSQKDYDVAKAELIALGLLDKRGAITIKGRNS